MAKHEDSPAKLAILQEWDFWAKEHPEAASLSGSLRFFEYLKNRLNAKQPRTEERAEGSGKESQ